MKTFPNIFVFAKDFCKNLSETKIVCEKGNFRENFREISFRENLLIFA
jgi:hypothetical protein